MTPDDLIAWRERLQLTPIKAANLLDISLRTLYYLESGKTSAGAPRDTIPRQTELSTQKLELEYNTKIKDGS